VLRVMVTSINGVQNRFGAGARERCAESELYRLGPALRRIQVSGAIGMRVGRVKASRWPMSRKWSPPLKAAGKTAEFVIYSDAPHAFHTGYRPSCRENSAIDAWARCLAWFNKYLKG
jgi:dienelactone hydrolase